MKGTLMLFQKIGFKVKFRDLLNFVVEKGCNRQATLF